jgi:hypothetical protein
MQLVKEQINIVKYHWKTSIAGVFIGIFTLMFVSGEITVSDWVTAIGTIGALIGLLSKDPDKIKDKD